VIAVPSDRVFAALLDPEAIVEWLPPGDMTVTIERFDARPGGAHRMTLRYPDPSVASGKTTADTDVVEGHFVEIVPGTRVVQAVDFVSDDPSYRGTMIMTWELSGVGGGTRVRVTADKVADAISAGDHAAGLMSSLAKLADYLER
jgi:uncharacterized protein YndB with AHSA1/START domain